MDDLLREAIADAKSDRETALANAKIALEEAFTPQLQSMLSAKLAEDDDELEMEPDVAPEDDVIDEPEMAPEEEPVEGSYMEDDEVPGEEEIPVEPEISGDEEEIPMEPEMEDILLKEEKESWFHLRPQVFHLLR